AKSRRASAYAAGTPSSSDRATTTSATISVTSSTSARLNSRQASAYQFAVNADGSQESNQFTANELTTTERISAARLTRKNATPPHTIQAYGPARSARRRNPGAGP